MNNYLSQIDQVLLNTINKLKQNIDIIKQPISSKTVPIEELNEILKKSNVKHVSQGGSRAGLAKEILTSSGYTRCVPIIIRDNLNNYAMKLHLDANRGYLSREQIGELEYFPKGILNVAIIEGVDYFKTSENTKNQLLEIRKDIVNFEVIPIQETSNRYSVTYDSENDNIYIAIEGQDTVKKASGLDLKLDKRIPDLYLLAQKYNMNIANTFFM